MTEARRTFLRRVMQTAWSTYSMRHLPGSTVRTFADALRNAWAFHKRQAEPAIRATRHLRLNTMVASPIRRSLGASAYASRNAAYAGRTTLALGL